MIVSAALRCCLRYDCSKGEEEVEKGGHRLEWLFFTIFFLKQRSLFAERPRVKF